MQEEIRISELIEYLEKRKNLKLKQGGKLADLAPTMLDLINLEKPEEMTGESLLDRE